MSAVNLEGHLEQDAFGGPVLILRTADGSYQLQGDVPAKLLGRRVRVKGTEAAEQFGFAMVGPVIDVTAVEPCD